MVALLASPLARAMDGLSGSEWMRRRAMGAQALRSRLPITCPPGCTQRLYRPAVAKPGAGGRW